MIGGSHTFRPVPSGAASRGADTGRADRAFRWLMLSLSLLAMVGMLFLGRLQTDPQTLEESIRSGDVETVTTRGTLTANGQTDLLVDWNRGVLKRWSSVSLAGEQDVEKVKDGWREQGVEVTSAGFSGGAHFYSWRAPAALFGLAVTPFGIALSRVFFGPQPLRMRKWGWSWILALPLLGPLLFYAFGEVAGRRERQTVAVAGVDDPRLDGLAGFAIAVAIGFPLSVAVDVVPFL